MRADVTFKTSVLEAGTIVRALQTEWRTQMLRSANAATKEERLQAGGEMLQVEGILRQMGAEVPDRETTTDSRQAVAP